jgi:formiminoglutamase
MAKLQVYDRAKVNSMFQEREHETKWGQSIQLIEDASRWQEELQSSMASYVILGLPEDIGIRGNFGKPGADKTFELAISSLLNIQQNKFQDAHKVLLLGHIDFSEEMKRSKTMNVEDLRALCAEIDHAVYPIVQSIIASGKKLIAIGGGHNNAYPLLKGSSLALGSTLNCINIDPHTDYRINEGRHSGNGFRFAKDEGYLHKYGVFGLHENYNAENILLEIEKDPSIQYITFEDIAIRKRFPMELALNSMVIFLQKHPCGIELDMDSIIDYPTSAVTSTGWNTTEARSILHQCSTLLSSVYLHITEGSLGLASEHECSAKAKYIAYLVSDFIKSSGN